MSKYCPITNSHVVYLTCQECEEKVCEDKAFYLLVAGCRDYHDTVTFSRICRKALSHYLSHPSNIVIVSGGATGTDAMAEKFADENFCRKKIFPAEWEKYGKRAGYIRNRAMHEYISRRPNRGVLLFWDGKSPGTRQSIELAKEFRNEIKIWRIDKNRLQTKEEFK